MGRMKFEVLYLRIRGGEGSSFELEIESPAGNGQAAFEIPEEVLPWTFSDRWDLAGDQRDVFLRRPPTSSPEAAEEKTRAAGKALFEAVFPPEVAGLFHSSLGRLRGDDEGLRIRIEIDPRGRAAALLQMLPWELLCVPATGDFLALSRRTPIVRFLQIPRQRALPLPNPRRLRILCVGDNSLELERLDLAKERDLLQAAWKGRKREVAIEFKNRCTLAEIRRAFVERSFHVLLFIGHGFLDQASGRGQLVFTNPDGTPQPVDGAALAREIADFSSTLRLVVLNACSTAAMPEGAGSAPFTDVAGALVMGGVPAVVAMRGPVSDAAAIAFSRTFFENLADDQPIDAGLAEARKAIRREKDGESQWLLPALFLRQADGYLFRPEKSKVWAFLVVAALIAVIVLLARGLENMRQKAEAGRLSEVGAAKLGEGDIPGAFEAFDKAVALDPANPELLNRLSMSEERLGKLDSAVAHAQEAVRLGGGSDDEAAYQYNLGALFNRIGRKEDALRSLQRALDRDGRLVPALNEMGIAFLDLGRHSDARRAFEKGIEVDPAFAPLTKNLARVELGEGHSDRAAELLAAAADLYPLADWSGRAETAYWSAFADSQRDRAAEACRALSLFHELAPNQLSEFDSQARSLGSRLGCSGAGPG